MATQTGLMVGVKIKEIATKDHSYTNCTVLHSDAIGLVFEVQRTVSEGGTIENVVDRRDHRARIGEQLLCLDVERHMRVTAEGGAEKAVDTSRQSRALNACSRASVTLRRALWIEVGLLPNT